MCTYHVQNVFLKMLQIEPRIPQGSEKAYLLTIAANMCKNQLKSAHRRKAVSFDDSKAETGECAYTMDEGDIVACMQQLPEKYRVAIHLHYYEGYTFEEIAGMLHISKSAVFHAIQKRLHSYHISIMLMRMVNRYLMWMTMEKL